VYTVSAAPEVKLRFGRYLERTGGRPVFDTQREVR
jgi:hypothetical protein